MKSPFPGMDPYLEAHWRDVHSALVSYARDALNTSLPADLIARMEERIAIETEEEVMKLIAPDVRVFETSGQSESPAQGAGAAVAEPILLKAQVEPFTERYVTIVEAATERLVTVVEFLSPTNKRQGEGLRDYLGKRKKLIEAGVNVVEIDLVRAGDTLSMLMPFVVPPKHRTTYRATVRRGNDPGQMELYPIDLRQRLPLLPIPLRPSDSPVTLDLQGLVDQAYRNGRYDRTTDYSKPCDPPLIEQDLEWANQLLRGAGRSQ